MLKFSFLSTQLLFVGGVTVANASVTTANYNFDHLVLDSKFWVLADSQILSEAGVESSLRDPATGAAIAQVTRRQKAQLSRVMHSTGRCGGYELLGKELDSSKARSFLADLRRYNERNLGIESTIRSQSFQSKGQNILSTSSASPILSRHEDSVRGLLREVDADSLRAWVESLSDFQTRYHSASSPNAHVNWLERELRNISAESEFPIQIDQVDHTQTQQRSLRLRIRGSEKPDEFVVLGGHLDSTVGWFSGNRRSPGVDDNASGSSNLIEAFRILLMGERPKRSVEFIWYAAEEVGLVGSAQIAQDYKRRGVNVVGVLQLDMTLFSGSGRRAIASMQDFTDPVLRELLKQWNEKYELGATILADRCGYGCSDHASWHRQGFPALMPFESTFADKNPSIHTSRDEIRPGIDFEHSSLFTKIAIVFASELSFSEETPDRLAQQLLK